MTESKLVLPVLTEKTSATESQTTTRGSLASAGRRGIAKSAASKLAEIAIDTESLQTTVAAAMALAAEMQKHTEKRSGIRLKEFEVSMGISATGKVGLLGVGVDVECEASFAATFSID